MPTAFSRRDAWETAFIRPPSAHGPCGFSGKSTLFCFLRFHVLAHAHRTAHTTAANRLLCRPYTRPSPNTSALRSQNGTTCRLSSATAASRRDRLPATPSAGLAEKREAKLFWRGLVFPGPRSALRHSLRFHVIQSVTRKRQTPTCRITERHAMARYSESPSSCSSNEISDVGIWNRLRRNFSAPAAGHGCHESNVTATTEAVRTMALNVGADAMPAHAT